MYYCLTFTIILFLLFFRVGILGLLDIEGHRSVGVIHWLLSVHKLRWNRARGALSIVRIGEGNEVGLHESRNRVFSIFIHDLNRSGGGEGCCFAFIFVGAAFNINRGGDSSG